MLMERFLRKYDTECMKMMMLKHEETFRQQVHELHRLYRVQKLLMREMKNNEIKTKLFTNHHGSDSCQLSAKHRKQRRRVLNLELPADEYIERAEEDTTLALEQDGDTELTLTVGSNWRKREDASLSSDLSFSSSSTESRGLKLAGNGWELQQMEDAGNSFDCNGKNGFELEGLLREERLKQPSWHLQYLSLKMA